MGTADRLAQLREHRMEMDRLLEIAVESGMITKREAGKEQIVQQVCAAIERQRSQEPEMTP